MNIIYIGIMRLYDVYQLCFEVDVILQCSLSIFDDSYGSMYLNKNM